ncbi:MAG: 2'-5' RNA ligase [Oleispira sp.]|jgi:2'-5' RNA ligase
MKEPFLDHEVTQPTELRDFFEWHQGIKYFGFWAIEIKQQQCLQQIKIAQQHLAKKLHPHYLRQPHITVCASGLLDEQHFTHHALQQQIEKLQESKLTAFPLKLSQGNSFSTAPYLAIRDPSNALMTLRKLLNSICIEQDAAEYVPHVTLGFYNQAYNTTDLATDIANLSTLETDFIMKEIVFAHYNTNEIQGRYQVLHRIALNTSDETKTVQVNKF